MNDKILENKVKEEMEKEIEESGFASPIKVLLALKYIDEGKLNDWKAGKIPNLERILKLGPQKVLRLLAVMSAHAKKQGWKPKREEYLLKGKPLQFSVSNNPVIEEHYTTHFVDKWWREDD